MSEPYWQRVSVDAEGREVREACFGRCVCLRCDALLDMVAETESWTEATAADVANNRPGWKHSTYGPGQAVCCGLLNVERLGGACVDVYRLRAEG